MDWLAMEVTITAQLAIIDILEENSALIYELSFWY